MYIYILVNPYFSHYLISCTSFEWTQMQVKNETVVCLCMLTYAHVCSRMLQVNNETVVCDPTSYTLC
jgi:hypothetical protein